MLSLYAKCFGTSLLFISVRVRDPKYVPDLTVDTSDVAHHEETHIYTSCIQSKQLPVPFPLHKEMNTSMYRGTVMDKIAKSWGKAETHIFGSPAGSG